MTLVAESRVEYVDNRFVQVSIIVNNDGVLATHFCDNLFYACLIGLDLTGPFQNAKTNVHGTGKGDEADVRMVHQVVTNDAATAWSVVEHAFG